MRDPDHQEPSQRSIAYTLVDQAANIGDALWLASSTGEYTFDEANRRSNELAAGLRSLDVGRGDTVAIYMDNSFEFVFLVMALGKLGAIWVPINTAYKGEFLRRTLEHSGAQILVTDAALVDRVQPVLRQVPVLHTVLTRGADVPLEGVRVVRLEEVPVEHAGEQLKDADSGLPFSVLYTSGTTGPSKGAVLTHNFWYRVARAEFEVRDVADGDRWFHPVPMFHGSVWLHTVMPALLTGTTAVGVEDRFSASQFWDKVREYRATQIVSIGAMHMFLWNQPERPDDADNAVRVWTPVPLPPELHDPFMKRFGVEKLVFYYGQTECMIITQGGATSSPGAAGWPRKDLEVKVLDDGDWEVPVGEVGEICIRPKEPNLLFSEYLANPSATLDSFRNLWHHTGDLGRFNERDELFFVDRKQDYLRRRGENISSFEVEAAIAQHPEVDMVVAHALPSEATEDEVKICVVLKDGSALSHLELASFCDDQLPYYAVPRYIEFLGLDELPLTASNRPQKYLLRDRGVTAATWDAVAAGFQPTR
jgi:crotonobetaine/carnitine-CoA ligase